MRTIGVLTKPDRISAGDESNWLPYILGDREPLQHNWYCVKQPSANDLKANLSWKQARDTEDRFFETTSPWSGLDPANHRYLRTSNLVERLSLVLSDLIAKRLPKIQEELEKAVNKAREALSALPVPPSSNPFNAVAELLHRFSSDLKQHIEQGIPDAHGLIQTLRPAQTKFRYQIRATAPEFRPYDRPVGPAELRKFPRATFLDKEDGVELEDGYDSSASVEDGVSNASVSEQSGTSSRQSPQVEDPLGVIYINEVVERASNARTRELPGHIPFVVRRTYIQDVIRLWDQPAMELVNTVHGALAEYVKELVTRHFTHFGTGLLEQHVKAIVHRQINECLQNARKSVEWLLRLESAPFTLNEHYLSDYREKFYTFYKGERDKVTGRSMTHQIDIHKKRSRLALRTNAVQEQPDDDSEARRGALAQDPIARIMQALAELGQTRMVPEDLLKLLPNDEMEHAIAIMADVRAYFQVAYKRFADNVPLAIDTELVRGILNNLLPVLYEQLGMSSSGTGTNGMDGHKMCAEFAQESGHIALKRVDLEKKLERLERASGELMNVGLGRG